MEEENEFNNANAPAFANPGSEYGPGSTAELAIRMADELLKQLSK